MSSKEKNKQKAFARYIFFWKHPNNNRKNITFHLLVLGNSEFSCHIRSVAIALCLCESVRWSEIRVCFLAYLTAISKLHLFPFCVPQFICVCHVVCMYVFIPNCRGGLFSRLCPEWHATTELLIQLPASVIAFCASTVFLN